MPNSQDLNDKNGTCASSEACSSCSSTSKTKSKAPKKWTQLYPQGTKEGDEEQRFFIALSRDPQYDWRSVAAVSKESRLDEKRVEEILAKYYKKGIVFQNPTNETLWGYWERVPQMLPKNCGSVTFQDQQKRIKGSMKKPN